MPPSAEIPRLASNAAAASKNLDITCGKAAAVLKWKVINWGVRGIGIGRQDTAY